MTMSFTSLTADKTTVGSIKSWQNYSKMDAEGILEEAQSMIYMRLRCREMKTSDQFAVKAGAASYDLPEGFLDPIMVKDITNDVEIDYKDDLQGAQFVIKNPNATTTCGCGSSFSV